MATSQISIVKMKKIKKFIIKLNKSTKKKERNNNRRIKISLNIQNLRPNVSWLNSRADFLDRRVIPENKQMIVMEIL